jgi:hypothetical protein
MYQIIEVHLVYKNNKINEIAVMWLSNELGWVRASYCNTKPIGGYKYLLPSDVLNEALIQEAAGYGMNLLSELKDKYFPGKRKWEKY